MNPDSVDFKQVWFEISITFDAWDSYNQPLPSLLYSLSLTEIKGPSVTTAAWLRINRFLDLLYLSNKKYVYKLCRE